MIEADKRNAVFLLHEQGMSAREIAQRLALSRNTVREIVGQRGETPGSVGRNTLQIDTELLRKLYQECDGRAQRVWEKLQEEVGIDIKYSTLTRMLRKEAISKSPKPRSARVPDEPGAEMQHDTSPYNVKLSGKSCKVIGSLIYMRYSKRRYVRFYRRFNRFSMKCFLHEALMHWEYSAPECIIDNTNLARLRGTGKNAVIVPEMEAFAKGYGFRFCCHALDHPNRKAGEERSFWTLETNFFPGRTFEDMEDLNRQAFEWATVRMENRPQTKANLIPAVVFEYEQSFLTKLLPYLPAPYRVRTPGIDQYGYVALDTNFYWVPEEADGTIKVLEYSDCFKIYQARKLLIQYPIPPDGTKNKSFSPKGCPPPRYKPKNRKHPTEEEEKHLRQIGQSVEAYLDFSLATKGNNRHEFLRRLTALSRSMTPELFQKIIERAHKYRISNIETIRNIARLSLGESHHELPFAKLSEAFIEREAYREGFVTDKPDLSVYQNNDNDEKNEVTDNE